MITPEKLAEIIQNARYNAGQSNVPPINVPWDKLNHYDKSHAIHIATEILEHMPKRDNELYEDVKELKVLAIALKRALNEYCSEDE
jgi:hypothetical protein